MPKPSPMQWPEGASGSCQGCPVTPRTWLRQPPSCELWLRWPHGPLVLEQPHCRSSPLGRTRSQSRVHPPHLALVYQSRPPPPLAWVTCEYPLLSPPGEEEGLCHSTLESHPFPRDLNWLLKKFPEVGSAVVPCVHSHEGNTTSAAPQVPHLATLCVCLDPDHHLCSERPQSCWVRATPLSPHFNLITPLTTLSPCTIVFSEIRTSAYGFP